MQVVGKGEASFTLCASLYVVCPYFYRFSILICVTQNSREGRGFGCWKTYLLGAARGIAQEDGERASERVTS